MIYFSRGIWNSNSKFWVSLSVSLWSLICPAISLRVISEQNTWVFWFDRERARATPNSPPRPYVNRANYKYLYRFFDNSDNALRLPIFFQKPPFLRVIVLCVFVDYLRLNDLKLPLRSWKAGRFSRMSLTSNSHPIVTRGSRVSRTPPHHTLPAFLNLYGSSDTWGRMSPQRQFRHFWVRFLSSIQNERDRKLWRGYIQTKFLNSDHSIVISDNIFAKIIFEKRPPTMTKKDFLFQVILNFQLIGSY